MKLKLTEEGVATLLRIQKNIKEDGKSHCCPYWLNHMQRKVPKRLLDDDNVPCTGYTICKLLFPRVCVGKCPCDCYTPKYLIQRINEILSGVEI